MTLRLTFTDGSVQSIRVIDGYQFPAVERGVIGPIYDEDGQVWVFPIRNVLSVRMGKEGAA